MGVSTPKMPGDRFPFWGRELLALLEGGASIIKGRFGPLQIPVSLTATILVNDIGEGTPRTGPNRPIG
jgi:hypothetical protein